MSETFQVSYLEGPGVGVVHLQAGVSGPAGPAPVQPAAGVACWFDPLRHGLPTDFWIDLDLVDVATLQLLLGPDGPLAKASSPPSQLTVEPDDLVWLGAGSRLAALELVRSGPVATGAPALWAVEAALLQSSLVSQGLGVRERLEDEVEAMLPALDERRQAGTPDDIAVYATALAHAVADPFSEAYGRLGADLGVGGSLVSWPELDIALDALRPASLAAVPTFLDGGDPLAIHDQLWTWLPRSYFPGGEFSGLVFVEQQRKGLKRRLRILMTRPADETAAIFVRLVANGTGDPEVLAIDAMLAEDEWLVAEMDEPASMKTGTVRVEAVDDLARPLLDEAEFDTAKATQWARLALSNERARDRNNASRQWYLSESFHRKANSGAVADIAARWAAGESGESESLLRPFWAEGDSAPRLDEDDS